jgi:hypothetical protein
VYGFHKVPHLNDGALHTENAPETWEFINEDFNRDNPDLPGIVRKKNEAEKARSAKRQGSPESKPRQGPYPAIEASPSTATSADLAVVYEEIRNIKRLQGSVIAELKRLKTDNEALWTEAAEARARYDQQQATINKMLKFLSTVFSPSKSNAASLQSRNKGLLTGPPPFEELSDDPVDNVLTPEAQETGARELSNLFGGAQPILPINAEDASWWQNLIKNGNDAGLFTLPIPSYIPQNDDIAPYHAPPAALSQHKNSLAAMEHAVNQTDQSIGRISNVLGINDWNNYNFANPSNSDGLTFFDPFIYTENTNTQPEYRFEDYIRSITPPHAKSHFPGTDENGTILDQKGEDNPQQPPSPKSQIESLSREATPKVKEKNDQNQNQGNDGTRKRTRTQSDAQGESSSQKKSR